MFLLEVSLASWPPAQPGTQRGQGWAGLDSAILSFLWAQGPFSKQKLGHVGWNRILFLSTNFIFVKTLTRV